MPTLMDKEQRRKLRAEHQEAEGVYWAWFYPITEMARSPRLRNYLMSFANAIRADKRPQCMLCDFRWLKDTDTNPLVFVFLCPKINDMDTYYLSAICRDCCTEHPNIVPWVLHITYTVWNWWLIVLHPTQWPPKK